MKGTRSSRLVIDASIARASGGINAIHPSASVARDFLQKALDICHKVVMTPAMGVEWNNHQSIFARKWRRSMVARKKMISFDPPQRSDLRNRISEGFSSDKDKFTMIKDFLLIEAAIATDERIVSLDDRVKTLFSKESPRIPELRSIVWINPVTNSAGATALLEGNATLTQWTLETM